VREERPRGRASRSRALQVRASGRAPARCNRARRGRTEEGIVLDDGLEVLVVVEEGGVAVEAAQRGRVGLLRAGYSGASADAALCEGERGRRGRTVDRIQLMRRMRSKKSGWGWRRVSERVGRRKSGSQRGSGDGPRVEARRARSTPCVSRSCSRAARAEASSESSKRERAGWSSSCQSSNEALPSEAESSSECQSWVLMAGTRALGAVCGEPGGEMKLRGGGDGGRARVGSPRRSDRPQPRSLLPRDPTLLFVRPYPSHESVPLPSLDTPTAPPDHRRSPTALHPRPPRAHLHARTTTSHRSASPPCSLLGSVHARCRARQTRSRARPEAAAPHNEHPRLRLSPR